MSLFKARDWWSVQLGQQEHFDLGCLCVGDIDNTGHDKVVVGSYMGVLRVFAPHGSVNVEEGQSSSEAQLLEVQLPNAIIQLEVGKFVSCSDLLHLAVLQPRRLSVYCVSGISGTVDHGDQYQLKLVYEHNLQRTSCNMTFGSFGGVTGHHSLCVQSMDGVLTFFEQDSFSFCSSLPDFLLPGPVCYNERTDSFITVSSARQLESYKYETLAVASETDLSIKGGGKRLSPDWVLVLGEQALDICVPSFSHATSSIFVLGERNLYCLRDNGQIRFMKKFEFNPSCFLPYTSVSDGTTNTLLGNHSSMLLVYQDVTLKWASQLSFVPVALKVANFVDLKGVVVSLSSEGHLVCSYMGTDPSFFSTPKVDAREVDYDQVEAQMKQLQKVIREVSRTQDVLKSDAESELTISVVVSSSKDQPSKALIQVMDGLSVPSVSVQVTVKASRAVQRSKVTISVRPPLSVTHDQFVLEPLGVGASTSVKFSVFLHRRFPPADLSGDVTVSYSLHTGVPRVVQSRFSLPLSLVCVPTTPSKSSKFKVTLETNKPPVDLSVIFQELASECGEGNSLCVRLLSGATVTVVASKSSERYRVQSDVFEDLWLLLQELVLRLDQIFSGTSDLKKSFSGTLPLPDYFLSVDRHFLLRVSAQQNQDLLSERAVQFRAIQHRLLTRFKDKTPAPLQNLDLLLDSTYSQVMALADTVQEDQEQLEEAFVRLRSATYLLVLLITLWQNLTRDQSKILEASLLPLLEDTPQLGWEESCEASVSHLLKTCLSRSSKDQNWSLGQSGGSGLGLPRDTSRLKKHVTLLCERLGKGGRLSLASEANVSLPAQVQNLAAPGGLEPGHMTGDAQEVQQEAPTMMKKKQPSKKVKREKEKEVKEPLEPQVKEKVENLDKEATKEVKKVKEEVKEEPTKEVKKVKKVKEEVKEEAQRVSKKEKKECGEKKGMKKEGTDG